ncbi:helix-turn-helix transcriptional regulator [Pseudomonas edaphica]|uniref:Helix-turn-helix transcriptional regulator n=1 Tax=Pseudomonas edaphica TaxID=2006980 RepID=A0A5R8R290_9PSED|nr:MULTISPECIES: helix-turn-helix transcriptional regulator [Pseudomonas]MCF5140920.1 helix-turn-helix transcriptional regulator [Pseudomonas sp. PA-6-3C]MCF5148823.1 helix-turn-helix transcriptional regulator [Pseudomonas sp. PA-6-3F]MCF5161273.1 helix-turn-helix transcriptional regulator [Pseudomonas sp. PA-6-2E]MCF5178939.1 helix-turn-helix transcriptional regulator [Pseudomonas sp. PA-6-1D]MCF5191219.1 helix-turn-helix transcriptional regulator [Pseudomonas sp. PA-6-1H]
MSLTSSIGGAHSPQFYAEMGELISNSGQENFAANMLHLVDKWVPIHLVDLSEWTLDELRDSAIDIQLLGSAGLKKHLLAPQPVHALNDHPLLREMLRMQDPLLIQMKAKANSAHPRGTSHQCNLVSRQGNRRCVISFYRPPTQQGFSLAELSFLKCLSDTLLPLMERHARILRQAPHSQAEPAHSQLEQSQLQREFYKRLSLSDITLSAREQEVCLGLLTGGTVPQMAEKLSVKNSSIETYLKRAAAKLGVSGRHGLAKWMVGA